MFTTISEQVNKLMKVNCNTATKYALIAAPFYRSCFEFNFQGDEKETHLHEAVHISTSLERIDSKIKKTRSVYTTLRSEINMLREYLKQEKSISNSSSIGHIADNLEEAIEIEDALKVSGSSIVSQLQPSLTRQSFTDTHVSDISNIRRIPSYFTKRAIKELENIKRGLQ